MLLQQVLHSMYSETRSLGAGENYVSCTPLRLTQPGFHHGACGSGKRCAAFLTSLADDAYMSASPKDNILSREPGHLGYTQARLGSHKKKGVVTPAKPAALIRSGEQGIDLR